MTAARAGGAGPPAWWLAYLSVSKALGCREIPAPLHIGRKIVYRSNRDHADSRSPYPTPTIHAPWKLSVPRHNEPKSNQVRTWTPRGTARHYEYTLVLDPNGTQVVLRGSEPVLSVTPARYILKSVVPMPVWNGETGSAPHNHSRPVHHHPGMPVIPNIDVSRLLCK